MSRTCLNLLLCLVCTLISLTYTQDCASDISIYARDFEEGTADRWLYDNIAPGAECVAISRTLTDAEKCNEYVSSKPDSAWVEYENRRFDRALYPPRLELDDTNYKEYFTGEKGTILPKDACINACRIRSWCASAISNYDFDKCELHEIYGQEKTKVTDGIKYYIEKPQCPENGPPSNGSNSYYRLALKLFASQGYDMARTAASEAVMAGRLWQMNYWFYAITTLVAGDFSAESIAAAKMTLSELEVGEWPELSTYEQSTLDALVDALESINVPLSVASNSEQLFIDSSKTDSLAGVIAAISYKKAGRMEDFKRMLEEVIKESPSNIAALYHYLEVYGLNSENFIAEDKEVILTYTQSLLKADPNNPYAQYMGTIIYYSLNMPKDVLALTNNTLSSLPLQLSLQVITMELYLQIKFTVYLLSHWSNLLVNDLKGAQLIEMAVEKEADDEMYDLDTRGAFRALLYRQRSYRYFQFAFTESAAMLRTMEKQTVDDITAIDASEEFFTTNKLSQYMNRQYLVTQQIRNGSYENYAPLVDKWKKLRDDSPSFNKDYTPTVSYNLNLLEAEYSLMQGGTREEVLGSEGPLARALGLLLLVDATFVVQDVREMIGYAAFKLAADTPAPLGTVDLSESIIPNSLEKVVASIKASWPPNTPSKLNLVAAIQLSLGDIESAEETLEEATERVHNADIDWLRIAKAAVERFDEPVTVDELEPIPSEIPSTLTYDAEDMSAADGLDKDWTWMPEVTPMEPCTAYRWMLDSDKWSRKEKTSVFSSKTVSYPSTNAFSCQLRCLFETSFECKSFTFGFKRCLLHDQTYDEVAVEKRLIVEDEVHYDVPVCVEQSTDAYSQLVLGAKAMSNGLTTFAIEKFEEASELDPLMSLPMILRAQLVFNAGCSSAKMKALELLSEVDMMGKTQFETNLFNAVKNTVDGRAVDATSDFNDILEATNDSLVSNLKARLNGEAISNPKIAADYIYKISRDVLGSADDIAALRLVSPGSVMPRVFEIFGMYLQGKWQEVVDTADSISNDISDGRYIGSDSDSDDHLFIKQLKHFALLQMGRFADANDLYLTFKIREKLGAYAYASQIYTSMIDGVNRGVVETPGVLSESTCSDESHIVALAMQASETYVNPQVDDSIKASEKNMLIDDFISIENSRVEAFKDAWMEVSDFFYSLGKANNAEVREQIATRGQEFSAALAPSIVRDLGVQLIHPSELIVWGQLNSEVSLTSKDFSRLETELNSSNQQRAVTLWLRYSLLRRWRDIDETKRNASIAAAKDIVDLWSGADESSLYSSIEEYWKYPDPSQDVQVAYTDRELPEWAIYLIIGCSIAVLLAIVISCIVCLAVRQKNDRKKGTVYSGSIYSASTGGEAGMVPEHGEVMYGGHRNDGKMMDSEEIDLTITKE